MENTAVPAVTNPNNTLAESQTPNPTPAAAPTTTPPQPAVGDETKVAADETNSESGVPVTDVEKKMRRAERFGMPVQLSEQEKRNTRAERFRTGTGSQGSDTLRKSEEQKRKARAERFGLAHSTPDDNEAKKKARLARFAASKVDSVEEDKRKAREARFSQNSTTLSQTSSEGKVEKTAV